MSVSWNASFIGTNLVSESSALATERTVEDREAHRPVRSMFNARDSVHDLSVAVRIVSFALTAAVDEAAGGHWSVTGQSLTDRCGQYRRPTSHTARSLDTCKCIVLAVTAGACSTYHDDYDNWQLRDSNVLTFNHKVTWLWKFLDMHTLHIL